MVSIAETLKYCVGILKGYVPSPLMESEILLGFVLKMDALALKINKDRLIDKKDSQRAYDLCKRRSSGEPVAYITGTKEFMSLEFDVNPHVLIPRPDTEILVEYMIEKYHGLSLSILDLCTGSGAICCSLAHYMPDARVCATDISAGALRVAKKNAKKLGMEERIVFMKKDALSDYDFPQLFDVVVSNPPYIETSTISTLMTDVSEYEPTLALDGGDDGLIFYRSIVNNISGILKKGGELIFEIGFNQGQELLKLMNGKFSNLKVSKDLSGNDRMVTGQLI